MNFIIKFFKKYIYTIFFMLFMLLGNSIYYYSNTNSLTLFNEVSLILSTYFHKQISIVSNYFHISQENENLKKENLKLRKSLPKNFLSTNFEILNKRDSFFSQDSILHVRHYDYIIASVFNNNYNSNGQFLQLFRGHKQGVRIGNGVVGAFGALGIVAKTTSNYSLVYSLLNKYTKVSAQIKGTKIMGIISWDETHKQTLKLNNISKTSYFDKSFQVGDTIVTSYYSDVFPRNVSIGTIKEVVVNGNSNFLNIKVLPTINFNFIKYAYIVIKKSNNELKQINNY